MFHYPRQEILAPVGLVTEPNEYKQYPSGALKIARNLTTRAPGKLLAAPNVRNTVTIPLVDATLLKLIPTDEETVHAVVDDSGVFAIYTDGVVATWPGLSPPVFSRTGRISWAECNRRVIVNGSNGCIVTDPVPISTDFRAPGLPQPSIVLTGLGPIDGWLDVDQSVQYRACFVRRYGDDDDYVLRSTPSTPVRRWYPLASGPGKRTVTMDVKWPTGAGLEAGDIIEIYRTNILATSSVYADTGDTYKLVKEYTLTAADVAAPPPAGLHLIDVQPPVFGTLVTAGRELYTNPGVEGENYANLRPPIAQCIVSFKGFCFYGNTTERALLTFSIPGGWGLVSAAPAAGVGATIARNNGIGTRGGAGTVTAGSAIITLVPAADLVGVVVGQQYFGGDFPIGTRVIAVGAATITMDQLALGAGATWLIEDVIEINGTVYSMGEPFFFLGAVPTGTHGVFEVQINTAIPGIGVYLSSLEVKLMWNSAYPLAGAPLIVRATHGASYSPPLPEIAATAKTIEPLVRRNRFVWTKEQQPEHAPSVSENFAGFGEIYAMNATRDCVWVWCSDGLFRLSGNAGSLGLGAWQVDYAIATLLLCAPQASTVLTDKLYGYTNEGVVEIDSAGNVSHKTRKVIGDLLPGPRYQEVPNIILERNERSYEVLLAVGEGADFAERIYVYHAGQKCWTYLDDNDDSLSAVSALGMFRLPPAGAESHMLIGTSPGNGAAPRYSSWNADNSFLEGEGRYQPIYGEDPLELKRWMWADYLFARGTTGSITALWNEVLGFGPVLIQALDAGVYARAGVPRQVGLSHSLSPGFRWAASATQRVFEGLSLAVKQRTNQSKKR